MRLFTFSIILLALPYSPSAKAQVSGDDGKDAKHQDESVVLAADGGLGTTMTLEQLGKTGGKPARGTIEDETEKYRRPILLQPAAEPVPALKIRFRPLENELHPGSAQLHFYRALLMFQQIPDKGRNEISQWFPDQMPPMPEVAKMVSNLQNNIFDEIHTMSLCEDFEMDHRLRDIHGVEKFAYLLPDTQESRSLARLLAMKCREELSRKDFDAAFLTIRDGFQLARLVGNGETMIQQLVGLSIDGIMKELVQEAIATPGCPNLYWALATLPRPMIDMRRSIELELSTLRDVFPLLNDVETKVYTNDELLEEWLKAWGQFKDWNLTENTNAAALPMLVAGPAKQRLLASGFDKEKLATMPPIQIVLIDASRDLNRWSDALAKGHLLPPYIGESVIEKTEREFAEWSQKNRNLSVGANLAGLFFPAVSAGASAQTRQEMVLNRLMTIEALRMHAATHQGQLPETLAELDPVPALPNPYDGKPFEYSKQIVDGKQTARLRAALPPNLEFMAELNLVFELPTKD